jgi:plasmid maintenance system antidote protein VapI
MENTISFRFSLIISKLGLTKNSFSKAIGLTNNVTIGRIINENRQPSYEILEKTIQTFGSINANWLLTGEGEMFLENVKKEEKEEFVKPQNTTCKNCEILHRYIETLEAKIAEYEGREKNYGKAG